MKLYTELSFPSQVLTNTGNEHSLYCFTGTPPDSIEDILFDYNDPKELVANAACINDVILQKKDTLINVINNVSVKRPSGHTLDLAANKFRLCPDYIRADHFDLRQEQIARLHTLHFDDVSAIKNMEVGEYFEFDFGKEVSLDEIRMNSHNTHNSYFVTEFTLKRLVGETWETCEDVSVTVSNFTTGISRILTSVEYTAQKFRLEAKAASSNIYYLGGFEFYGTTEPTLPNADEDFTWFLMQPIVEVKTFGSENPIIIGNAGGPNGNKEVALTHYKNEGAKEIKLMNLKLKSNVVGEV